MLSNERDQIANQPANDSIIEATTPHSRQFGATDRLTELSQPWANLGGFLLGMGDGIIERFAPGDTLIPPSKALDVAAYLTHVFTRDAVDRFSPTAVLGRVQNSVSSAGNWVMENVNGQGFADHLIDEGEKEQVQKAETILQIAEFTHDDEAQRLQVRSIVHILGRSFVRKVDKGETMLEDSILQLKHFLAELSPEDIVVKVGLRAPELRVLQVHFDLGEIEDLLMAKEVVDGLKRAFTG